MSIEAYCVSYDKVNYHAPIKEGQDRNSVVERREEEITNNILRYLGEYRLGVTFDEIFYREIRDSLGNIYLSSNGEGPVRNVFRKTIGERERKGHCVKREVAECLGFEKLEQELLNSPDNALFIWVSPPGSREDNYGDYSFTFVGQKIKDEKTDEVKIRVIPYRNILSQAEHKGYLRFFDTKTQDFKSDIDFLSNPIVLSPTEFIKKPEDLIDIIGRHEDISMDWLRRLKGEVGTLIKRYIDLVRIHASDEELTKVKFAFENLTISIKNKIIGNLKPLDNSCVLPQDLEKTIEIWGRNAPPRAAGSCGSSSKSTLMELHSTFNLENDKYGERTFECPSCGKTNIRPKDELISNCQHCGKDVAC
ncbi:MAG: hypothetical protein HYT07_03815 [Candidatus Levybacteria bacterium]|nr:hypothetical protein [Candidatus Levybacteria bacterium]